jgi:hypothetical protein
MTTTKKTSKTKGKPKVQAKPPTPDAAYAGHKPGSRKSVIHELFDRQDEQTAWVRGKKIGLKETTLRTWFAFWRRSAKPATAKKAAKTNSVAAPTTTKPEVATPAAAA